MRIFILAALLFCAAVAQSCKTSGCTSGNCCSYWGYCGKTNDYCGSGTYQCVCDCTAKGACVKSSTTTTTSCTNYVTTANLNVRKSGSTSAAIVRVANKGTTVCVVSTSGTWAKLNDGYYCSTDYLTKSGTTSSSTTTTTTSSSSTVTGLNIVQKIITADNGKCGTRSRTPDMIVCHIAEGTYSGTIGWLSKSGVEASCHYVVSRGGEVTQLVPLNKYSWCQGITAANTAKATAKLVKQRGVNPNDYCVGIEHEGMWSECKGCLYDAQKTATGRLIKHIQNEVKRIYSYTIPLDRDHIVGHYEINPSNKPYCPGANFPWTDVINIAKSA